MGLIITNCVMCSKNLLTRAYLESIEEIIQIF